MSELNLKQLVSEVISVIKFNEFGLVPAIAQQYDTKEVLMLAWMNTESIIETLKTGNVCYWSRSRKKLWSKGETSGHIQELIEFRIDCDGDTILTLVNQKGVACHTGRKTCFFSSVGKGGKRIIYDVEVDPESLYGK